MSTQGVTVEIISENWRETVTLHCSKSVNAFELTRLLGDQMSSEENTYRYENKLKPDKILLRDMHGTRLQPNKKISRVTVKPGTYLIAEVTGKGRNQHVGESTHNAGKMSAGSDISSSEDKEDLPNENSAESSADDLTPTKSKRRKVESEESGSTIDLTKCASSSEVEDGAEDQTSTIQTKRKSRKRASAKGEPTVIDDTKQLIEGQCQGCQELTGGSPTTRQGTKRKHGGLESSQSVSRVCPQTPVSRQEKTSPREQLQKTPNPKRNLIKPSEVLQEVLEGDRGSPEKQLREADAKCPKEDRLSCSMERINLDDGTDCPDRNTPSSAAGETNVPKAAKQGAVIPKSAVTSTDRVKPAQGEVYSKHMEAGNSVIDTVASKEDSAIHKAACNSADIPSGSRLVGNTTKEADRLPTAGSDVCGKCSTNTVRSSLITVSKGAPVNKSAGDLTRKLHFVVVPVVTKSSHIPPTVNLKLNEGVPVKRLVGASGALPAGKPTSVTELAGKSADNSSNHLVIPVSKAAESSQSKVTSIMVDHSGNPLKAGAANTAKGTVICELTLSASNPTTVDRSRSRVLKTYPGKARRQTRQVARANSKSEIDLICVDGEGCGGNNPAEETDGDSEPPHKASADAKHKAGEEDPIVITIGKNELRKSDLATLEEGEWLNDCVINAYFFLLSVVSPLKVFTHSSFFFLSLFKRGYEGVKRWTKNVDLFEQDLIFIPVHNKSHWSLVVVHIREGIIEYYNSSTMLDGYPRSMMHVRDYLQAEAKNREKSKFCNIKWELYIVEDIPRQQNMDDCGLFICQYAKKISLKQNVTFDNKETVNLRRQMLRELIRRKIEEY
ncbi:uncharacterized protein LOC110977818 [Acanthaster planci]|uniref:Uncharacterized protein LOC110977818 n=1 Tax=Acanthaster planci TaxID=133434 RepID=A0A8B7Y887_ACAPL|nr:uncharacterized protein LOC110977818 [Acanthaster planci]